jgi:polyribonucleotide 5'-hydroxyl-kinase
VSTVNRQDLRCAKICAVFLPASVLTGTIGCYLFRAFFRVWCNSLPFFIFHQQSTIVHTTVDINTTMNVSNDPNIQKPEPSNGERHTLSPVTELRLEIPSSTCTTITLLSGSAEIFGAELAQSVDLNLSTLKQSYIIPGPAKFAVFTWHGCVLDVDVEFGKSVDIMYTSEETEANVAYVNTHAQLEAMRDEALMNNLNASNKNVMYDGDGNDTDSLPRDGPRVLVVGPADSGKTSLVKTLVSYAIKLGRSPMLVDLDPKQNMLSVPGTLSAATMSLNDSGNNTNVAMLHPVVHATGGLYPGTSPLVQWFGSTDVAKNPDLYKEQLVKLGQMIDKRNDVPVSNTELDQQQQLEYQHLLDCKASGLIVNGCGWIEDVGFELMVHAVSALRIDVILVMGHDRLYSMLQSHFNKLKKQQELTMVVDNTPKIIKLPRSGGIVSRDESFRRATRSLCIRRYFYGQPMRNTSAPSTGASSSVAATVCPSASALIQQYSPQRLEVPFSDLTLYELSSVSLSASMLPVSAKQATDAVQLVPFKITPTLKHSILAVCHPIAVEKYDRTGEARELYLSGMCGMVAVEKVDMDREILSLLSPGGSLPSNVMLVGDITWMD